MHAETSMIYTPLFTLHRPGLRPLILIAVLATSLLAGCASRTARAPVADESNRNGNVATQAASGTYVVKAGDTLYKIAQAHNMDVARLSQLNNINNPSQLAVGQVLRMDGSGTASSGASASPAPVVTPIPVTPVEQPKADTASESGQRANDASLISWAWPAGGKVIQGFNANTKGIDIEGTVGAPVQAAADGKVMYAGNGVRGLGNLILLGHSNGFITAYAHNQSLLVKTGDTVKKGAKIAAIGQTDTTSPRLHFEVRRRGTPVNPLSYLPTR